MFVPQILACLSQKDEYVYMYYNFFFHLLLILSLYSLQCIRLLVFPTESENGKNVLYINICEEKPAERKVKGGGEWWQKIMLQKKNETRKNPNHPYVKRKRICM